MNEVSSDLIDAVRQGDVQEANSLIGPHKLRHSTEGYDLLMIALENNNSAMAKLLLTRDCLVRNRKRPIKDTPLLLAVRNGDLEIVSLLLDKGASGFDENQNDETPIGIAVEKGCLQTVELFLNHSAVDCTVKCYLDLLHIALGNEMKTCETNYGEMINLLLKKFVDMLAKTERPPRPLHMAAKYGSKDVLNFLLQQGYQVDGNDDDGKTVLFYAVARGDLTIVETVLKFHPNKIDPSNQLCLKTAVSCYGKDFDRIVLALSDYGFTVHPENAKDLQFFHGAVEKGIYVMVSYLLDNGADANAFCELPSQFKFVGSEILSPLHRAVKNRHERVAKLLINYKADVNAQGRNRIPPMFYSVENVDLPMTRLLLNNGADVKEVNRGASLLHLAVRKNSIEIVEALLLHDADINAEDIYGRTALHYTVLDVQSALNEFSFIQRRGLNSEDCTKTNLEIPQYLLSRGANVDVQTRSYGLTTLHASVIEGSEPMVSLLLRHNANVNVANRLGLSPLHISAEKGFVKISNMLLAKGANVNAIEVKENKTPLYFAVTANHREVVKILLESGANVNSKGPDDQTPLHLAAVMDDSLKYQANPTLTDGERVASPTTSPQEGNFELSNTLRRGSSDLETPDTSLHASLRKECEPIIYVLLRYNANVNSADIRGVTLLHIAAKKGNVELGTMLLDMGANVNAKEYNKETPLHSAVRSGHKEIIKLLLEYGADVNSKGAYGKTPLHLAAESDDSSKYSVNANSIDGLHASIEKESEPIIYVLLRHNANVNLAGKEGVTLLHISVQKENLVLTTLLVNMGADINAVEKNERTALHSAVASGNEQIVRLLLESAAHVNLADKYGFTPLHISVQKGNLELSTLLLNMGADVNAEKKNGDTALHLAAASGHEKIVILLLERGAHVNHKGMRQRSPLHWAAENNNSEIISALLEFGAEVNSRCEDGKTALHFSSQLGAIYTVTTLIEYGADVNITCEKFQTPLDYATNELRRRRGLYHPFEDTVHYLNRHHVKMEVAGLVSAGFWPSACEREGGLEDFHSECQMELTRVMSEFIEDTKVSYYDILRKDRYAVCGKVYEK